MGLHDDPVFCVYFYEEIFPRKVHVRNYLKDPDTNPLSVEVNENNDNWFAADVNRYEKIEWS